MIIQKENVIMDNTLTPTNDIQENIEDIKIENPDENSDNVGNIPFNDLDIDITSIQDEDEKTSQVSEEPIINDENEDVSEKKETVETNCLALTVRKNYNISILKNTVFTTFRITCKVTIFTFVLNFLRLFF